MRGRADLNTVAVVTDSIACLTPEQRQTHNIGVVPLMVNFGGKSYRDGVDVSATQAYEFFLQKPDDFTTSTPGPLDFVNAFRDAIKRGAESILCITVSSRLSSTHTVGLMAKQYAVAEMPKVRVEVMDSWTASAAEGFIALAAARAAESGARLDEVVKAAAGVKDRVALYVLLDTVRHVYRSGRVPRIASQAGSVLNIRPLFNISGKVHLMGVARSRERGLDSILHRIKEKVGNTPIHAAVMHAYAPDAAIALKERVAKEFRCTELWLTEFSPLMGYACGTGTLAVAFYSGD